MTAKQLHLSLVNPHWASSYTGGWRHPSTEPAAAITLESIISTVKLAEDACFDAVFFADSLVLPPNFTRDPIYAYPFDPLLLAAVLVPHTSRIGLISTVSTTSQHPYDVARKFATLDWASRGRSGWNIVTTANNDAARLFGESALPDPNIRYHRAAEYVELTKKLWNTFEPGAMVFNKATGVYADLEKIHLVDHDGEYFKLEGGLNAPDIPQGYPVFVQAGQSEAGRDFAARYAEMIFVVQNDVGQATEFAAEMRARATAHGRDPQDLKIFPGLWALVCSTAAEATRLSGELGELAAGATPEEGLRLVTRSTGLDLSGYDLDKLVPDPSTVPDSAKSEPNRGSGGIRFLEKALDRKWTIRQFIRELALSTNNLVCIGSADQAADVMQEWHEAGACDGFNVFPILQSRFADFAQGVVPILRERGVFRSAYTGATLRDHLGLSMPVR